ncbi:MAG: hypothetical protein IJS08_12930, partial [Victivallales bacterium]|nr:hypothetical protein [Victivallales bacterium]
DADAGVLTMFIDGQKNIYGSPRKLLYAGDSRSLKDNFKFITMSVTNSVALASKSKVLTVKPITVKETVINDLDGNLALMQEKKPLEEHGTEEESGFEW